MTELQPPPAGTESSSPAASAAKTDSASLARLFLALWPAPEESDRLREYFRQWTWPKGSTPVQADRMHLTLHFIGAVPAAHVPEIGAGLQVPIRPCELRPTQAAIWPRGIAVLQATQIPDGLAQLHADLARALRALGLPVEARRFRPHLTLARRAAGAVPPAVAPDLRWRVDAYALVESVLGHGGGYTIRQRYGGGDTRPRQGAKNPAQ